MPHATYIAGTVTGSCSCIKTIIIPFSVSGSWALNVPPILKPVAF